MTFLLIEGIHINVNQIRSFTWRNGELCIWYAGRQFFESWPDPDMKIYKALCSELEIKPVEKTEVEDG